MSPTRETIIGRIEKIGIIRYFETEVYDFNKKKYHASLSSSIIEFKGKLAVITTIVDITTRWQIEENLSKSEASYRLLAENIEEVVFITSPKVMKMPHKVGLMT